MLVLRNYMCLSLFIILFPFLTYAQDISDNNLNEFYLHRLEINSRKRTDAIIGFTTYGITLATAIGMGGENITNLYIPVIGPFLQLGVVDNASYTDESMRSRDKMGLILSGFIQAYIAYDYYKATLEERELKKKFSVFPIVTTDMVAFQAVKSF